MAEGCLSAFWRCLLGLFGGGTGDKTRVSEAARTAETREAFWSPTGDETRAARIQDFPLALGVLGTACESGEAPFWRATGDETRATRVKDLLEAVGVLFEDGVPANVAAREAALAIAKGNLGVAFWPATAGDETR
jgi:hypothetical protein